MLQFDERDVALDVEATSKDQVIALLANMLGQAGRVEDGYQQGMLAREQQTVTYLGEGIAIPHGTTDTRGLVKQTGLAVVRLKQPVDWGKDQLVTVAIGIAAQSDEHLDVLRQLTRLLSNPTKLEQLKTGTASQMVALLTDQQAPASLMLSNELIQLQQPYQQLQQARTQAAALLYEQGHVDEHYVSAMLAHQPDELDYLDEGIWLFRSAQGVNQSALAWVGLDQTRSYLDQPVNAVLALAAQGQLARPLLSNLQQLREQQQLDQLVSCRDADQLLALLQHGVHNGPYVDVTVLNPHGLHARPAAMLVQEVKKTGCALTLTHLGSGEQANASSLTALLGLGAKHGDTLRITGDEETPASALQQIADAITAGLGEQTQPVAKEAASNTASTDDTASSQTAEQGEQPLPVENELTKAISAAPGMAVGEIIVERHQTLDIPEQASDSQHEQQQFDAVLKDTQNELSEKIKQVTKDDMRAILSMHSDLLDDPELVSATKDMIKAGKTAAWAWHHSYESLASKQAQSSNTLLAERAADIRDVGARVLNKLLPGGTEQALPDNTVLVVDELNPSRVTELDPNKVVAVICAHGGATSHAAILARAAGLPMLVGAGNGVLQLTDHTAVIVDGSQGSFIVAPDEQRQRSAKKAIAEQRELEANARERRHESATTLDGHHVDIAANLGDTQDIDKAVEQGCDGVGLLRTEFLFMRHDHEPSEQEQIDHYRHVLNALDGKPLVVRTLDIGGDKPLSYLPMATEENPFLGVRGIRLCLQKPELLKRQLSALLKAAEGFDSLRIMFPMVSDIKEWRAAKAMIQEVAGQQDISHIQLGMMIEVPAAALRAEHFAKEVDFFSIGTNDLTQYTMAIDRGHPALSAQADALHPAVLNLIDLTVKAAHAHQAWVGVCGEAAADPLGAALFTGLGVDELSMSARSVPLIKERLRNGQFSDYQQLARQALAAADAQAVRQLQEQA